MRSLLLSMLLIVTVIAIYTAIAEGDDGMKQRIYDSEEAVASYIRRMSP